jgi:hypothetical protein
MNKKTGPKLQKNNTKKRRRDVGAPGFPLANHFFGVLFEILKHFRQTIIRTKVGDFGEVTDNLSFNPGHTSRDAPPLRWWFKLFSSLRLVGTTVEKPCVLHAETFELRVGRQESKIGQPFLNTDGGAAKVIERVTGDQMAVFAEAINDVFAKVPHQEEFKVVGKAQQRVRICGES